MEKILRELDYCRNGDRLISLHLNEAAGGCLYSGFVAACNKTTLLLAAVNERGEYDGFALLKIRDIYHIHYDGMYEGRLTCLYQCKEQRHPRLPLEESRLTADFLEYVKQQQIIACVGLGTSDGAFLTGTIAAYNEQFIQMECYNSYGCFEGVNVVELRMINIISADAAPEQDLDLLLHLDDR